MARKRALRKVFISVKGIYYEAEIRGEPVVWLVSHNMQQTLPEDVDYRVMLTFLEFYISMTTFVNHQLYHEDNLRVPASLGRGFRGCRDWCGSNRARTEEKDRKRRFSRAGEGKRRKSESRRRRKRRRRETEKEKENVSGETERIAQFEDGEDEDDIAEREAAERERERENEQLRMEENIEMMTTGDEADAQMATTITDEERNANLSDRQLLILDRKRRANLFNGLTFLIKRECPREAMVFIVKSFGGEVCWEGEGSPIDVDEEKDKITHVIMDRPVAERPKATCGNLARVCRSAVGVRLRQL